MHIRVGVPYINNICLHLNNYTIYHLSFILKCDFKKSCHVFHRVSSHHKNPEILHVTRVLLPNMPLILMCGFPSSGKTKRSLELKEYFENEKDKAVTIVSENDFLNKVSSNDVFECYNFGHMLFDPC